MRTSDREFQLKQELIKLLREYLESHNDLAHHSSAGTVEECSCTLCRQARVLLYER